MNSQIFDSKLVIPFDVVHSIINQVIKAKDSPTLRAFNATSRNTRTLVQKHLFAEVDLALNPDPDADDDYDDQMLRLRLLHDIITTTPAIGLHVEKLTLEISVPPDENQEVEMVATSVLQKISGVKHLTICSKDMSCGWDSLETLEIREAIYRLLSQESLIHVRIEGIDGFPVNVLRVCSQLNIIEIYMSNFDEDDAEESVPATDPPQLLTSLCTCRIEAWGASDVRNLCSVIFPGPGGRGGIFSARQLKTFSIFCDDATNGGNTGVREIVDEASETLQSLELDPGYFEGFDLSQFTKLKYLDIHQIDPPYPEYSVPYVIELIRTLPLQNQLEEFVIHLGHTKSGHDGRDGQFIEQFCAHVVDTPSLRRCRIKADLRASQQAGSPARNLLDSLDAATQKHNMSVVRE